MSATIPWEAVRAVIDDQPPGAGAEATWATIGRQWQVSRVLFSQDQQDAGYRVAAIGPFPAVLVLPVAWRLALPSVPPRWLIPGLC